MIRWMEEISLNAWPSLQTLFFDGWVLRFANGYTKRANSINPLYAGARDVVEKVRRCEQLYRGKALNVVFKMTPASQPDGLDAMLAAAGYQLDSYTSVQLLALEEWRASTAGEVSLEAEVTDEWLAMYCLLSGIDRRQALTVRRLLELVVPAKRLALLRRDGKVVACGMGIRQGEMVGLFDIVVDKGLRRQGYGQQLIEGLLHWGKEEGAHTAYLQVVAANEPAVRLYAKLGFREEYQYWYRVKRVEPFS